MAQLLLIQNTTGDLEIENFNYSEIRELWGNISPQKQLTSPNYVFHKMYLSPLYKMLKWIQLDQHCCTKTHKQSLNLMHHLESNYNALNCHRGEQFKIKREIWIRDFWFVFTLLKPWKVTGLTDPDYTGLLKHCNQRTKTEYFMWQLLNNFSGSENSRIPGH